MKKIKAPIDGKNVATDWIEEIFDHYDAVGHTKEHTNRLCGYINGELVEAMWVTGYNMLFWQVFACKDEEWLSQTKDQLLRIRWKFLPIIAEGVQYNEEERNVMKRELINLREEAIALVMVLASLTLCYIAITIFH